MRKKEIRDLVFIEAKLYLLYGGTEEYFEADIHVIPYKNALLDMPKIIERNYSH